MVISQSHHNHTPPLGISFHPLNPPYFCRESLRGHGPTWRHGTRSASCAQEPIHSPGAERTDLHKYDVSISFKQVCIYTHIYIILYICSVCIYICIYICKSNCMILYIYMCVSWTNLNFVVSQSISEICIHMHANQNISIIASNFGAQMLGFEPLSSQQICGN